jgi:hypothetical protein
VQAFAVKGLLGILSVGWAWWLVVASEYSAPYLWDPEVSCVEDPYDRVSALVQPWSERRYIFHDIVVWVELTDQPFKFSYQHQASVDVAVGIGEADILAWRATDYNIRLWQILLGKIGGIS